MKKTNLLLASLFSLALATSIPSVPVAAGTGTITGRLLDGDTGGVAPAVGVTVQACNAPGCQGSGVSDSNGNYTISGVSSGSWSVVTFPTSSCGSGEYGRAKADGVSVPDGGSAQAPTMLLSKHKGQLAGHIFDTAGHPLGGVTIFADNAEQGGNGFNNTTSLSSGDVGYYELDCLPAARGYFITTEPAQPYNQQTDSQFTVLDGQFVYHDVRLTQGSSGMRGHLQCGAVGCADWQILIGKLCPSNTGGCPISSMRTNGSGDFVTPQTLQAGSYDMHAFAPPGWDNGARFNITLNNGSVTDLGTINMIMSSSGSSGRIMGQVTDAAGAPYGDCRLNTFSQSAPGAGSSQGFAAAVPTDQNGNYDTGYVLQPGRSYRVWLDCPGHDEVTTNVDIHGSTINLGAGSTSTVNFFWAEPGHPWTGGHDAIGVAAPTTDAYFAEGKTNLNASSSYHEYLTVQNPNTFAETLKVDYFLGSGQVVSKSYNLAQQSRTTLNVNAEVGPNQRVGAHLHTDVAGNTFVAERPMYFVYGPGLDGGDDVIGAQSLGTTFNFAEGFTGAGFHEELALLNPNASDSNVTVTYFFPGQAPKLVPHTIPAHSAITVYVNAISEAGDGQDVSIQVAATDAVPVPFLAERSMYFPYPAPNGHLLSGGHVVVGTQQASQHLNLAEGYVGNGFYEYLTFLNSTANDATATITYNLEGGAQVQKTMLVPANSRQTKLVNDDLPAGTANSIHIESNQPLVVERPMYFTYQGRTGGHDAMAVDDSRLGTTFNFAEGFVHSCNSSPCFDEYYTILNNTAVNATVTITYFLEGGGTVVKMFPVLAHSRYTRWVNQANDPGQVGPDLPAWTANSAQVTSDQPILVERPMYFGF